MKIVACVKAVPEEQDIAIKSDKTLDLSKAELKVGQYDLNAVEAAVQLQEATGSEEPILVTVGSTKGLKNSKLQKAMLSRGAGALFGVADDSLDSIDAFATAKNLAAAISKIGGVELVICGEGSGDIYSQQVGPILGQLLGFANLNAVSRITLMGDKLEVERTLENEIEVLEVTLPAVLSVTTDINKARIPGLKEILAAGKKPTTLWGAADLEMTKEGNIEVISTLAPPETQRQQMVFEGDSEENIAQLLDNLRKVL
ncbi:MAG: putative electron transfer flavoprotein FixA [Syntrophomonadaceae bacterium]|nr:putative electron transfer flavoprotein FixA [Syntrophomonadaceae bacterium]